MSQTSHIDRLIDEISELRRLVLMAQPRLARVKEYKEGKLRVLYEGSGQQGGQGGQSGSGSGGGTGGAGGGSTGSGSGSGGGTGGGSQQEKEWTSPWLYPGENHVGHVREDTPYKDGQLVWVWTPNGDPNQAMVMPGPPSKEHKLPDHRDDKKRTRQVGDYKESLTTDGKTYKRWQTKPKQQGQQSGQQSGQASQTTQQQKEDKPKDILNYFELDSEGGLTVKSQKAFTIKINDDPDNEQNEMLLKIEPSKIRMKAKDGSEWTMEKEKIEQVADKDGQKYEWKKEETDITKGKVSHNNQNIGGGHRHKFTQSGSGFSGPTEDKT
jgi:hypothetical protein